MKTNPSGPLTFDTPEGNDYTLKPEPHNTVWIAVGAVSIHIRPQADGVQVDLYPNGAEAGECLATAGVSYEDAKRLAKQATP